MSIHAIPPAKTKPAPSVQPSARLDPGLAIPGGSTPQPFQALIDTALAETPRSLAAARQPKGASKTSFHPDRKAAGASASVHFSRKWRSAKSGKPVSESRTLQTSQAPRVVRHSKGEPESSAALANQQLDISAPPVSPKGDGQPGSTLGTEAPVDGPAKPSVPNQSVPIVGAQPMAVPTPDPRFAPATSPQEPSVAPAQASSGPSNPNKALSPSPDGPVAQARGGIAEILPGHNANQAQPTAPLAETQPGAGSLTDAARTASGPVRNDPSAVPQDRPLISGAQEAPPSFAAAQSPSPAAQNPSPAALNEGGDRFRRTLATAERAVNAGLPVDADSGKGASKVMAPPAREIVGQAAEFTRPATPGSPSALPGSGETERTRIENPHVEVIEWVRQGQTGTATRTDAVGPAPTALATAALPPIAASGVGQQELEREVIQSDRSAARPTNPGAEKSEPIRTVPQPIPSAVGKARGAGEQTLEQDVLQSGRSAARPTNPGAEKSEPIRPIPPSIPLTVLEVSGAGEQNLQKVAQSVGLTRTRTNTEEVDRGPMPARTPTTPLPGLVADGIAQPTAPPNGAAPIAESVTGNASLRGPELAAAASRPVPSSLFPQSGAAIASLPRANEVTAEMPVPISLGPTDGENVTTTRTTTSLSDSRFDFPANGGTDQPSEKRISSSHVIALAGETTSSIEPASDPLPPKTVSSSSAPAEALLGRAEQSVSPEMTGPVGGRRWGPQTVSDPLAPVATKPLTSVVAPRGERISPTGRIASAEEARPAAQMASDQVEQTPESQRPLIRSAQEEQAALPEMMADKQTQTPMGLDGSLRPRAATISDAEAPIATFPAHSEKGPSPQSIPSSGVPEAKVQVIKNALPGTQAKPQVADRGLELDPGPVPLRITAAGSGLVSDRGETAAKGEMMDWHPVSDEGVSDVPEVSLSPQKKLFGSAEPGAGNKSELHVQTSPAERAAVPRSPENEVSKPAEAPNHIQVMSDEGSIAPDLESSPAVVSGGEIPSAADWARISRAEYSTRPVAQTRVVTPSRDEVAPPEHSQRETVAWQQRTPQAAGGNQSSREPARLAAAGSLTQNPLFDGKEILDRSGLQPDLLAATDSAMSGRNGSQNKVNNGSRPLSGPEMTGEGHPAAPMVQTGQAIPQTAASRTDTPDGLVTKPGANIDPSSTADPVSSAGGLPPPGAAFGKEIRAESPNDAGPAVVSSVVDASNPGRDQEGLPQRSHRGKMMPLDGGTPVAQTEKQMKRSSNRFDFAESGEQELPGAGVGTSEAAVSRGTTPANHPREGLVLRDSDPTRWLALRSDLLLKTEPGTTDIPEATSIRTTTHERLLQSIQSEAQLVGLGKGERLSVVLRPDADTEILLRLRVQDGQVEAHARCERGNIDVLNAQWGQLQESLSACGVRLAPLANSLGSGYEWLNAGTGRFESAGSFPQQKNSQGAPGQFEREPQRQSVSESPRLTRQNRQRAERLLELWA